jgi:hypothetical protein
MGKGQTRPTTFDTLEQANENHILGPGIFGLVGLRGMIEDMSTAEDLSACLGIDEIIQGDQQTAIGYRTWDPIPQLSPQSGPWQFV